MVRPERLALLGLLLLTGPAAAETPTWQQHPSKNHPRKHVMVQFTDTTLHPSIAQVTEGGIVSWVNYGAMYNGSIVISEEVAAAFTCEELRPVFSKTPRGYQSIPITRGGASDDFELPCPLRPGEYEYEVWLFEGGLGGIGGMDDPQSRMQGKIVVQQAPAP